ncbi:hypothetical protein S7711_03552 [Stachybotrys chartarum IBT 7711]|uniref:MOSC domain-containing protein n=1 Tax=Stachybotrys chartarum (strain CBS 109288 / IBT 7711) TaxID=1280523 RepID=A0A084B1Q6_STACB|nr:hypothetical protein S7711_03552 [Stachybotrys chartarum IBT 7711]
MVEEHMSIGVTMEQPAPGDVRFDPLPYFLYAFTILVFAIPIFTLFPPIPVERSDALRQTHTKLGIHGPRKSNLAAQFHPSAHKARPGTPGRIQSLHVYPVKSCRGVELARSRVVPTGLEFDRIYTFAQRRSNAHDGDAWEFATQRQLPRLANVKVDLWLPDHTKTSRQLGKLSDAFIVVRFPWEDAGVFQQLAAKISRGLRGVPEKEFMVPVEFPSKQEVENRGYTFANVRIWKEITKALNMGKEIPPQLATYLGVKGDLALFRMDPTNQREVFRCAPKSDEVGYQPVVDFHDAYPLHLLSLSSVHDLSSKIQKDEIMTKLDARRFRANIIISGTDAYDEESWRLLRFHDANDKDKQSVFDVSCRTVRCKMPNVDPDTGIRHRTEPDNSLRKYRNVDEGSPTLGCLGMQMCPIFPDAEKSLLYESFVEVGMQIDVLKRGAHLYIEQ